MCSVFTDTLLITYCKTHVITFWGQSSIVLKMGKPNKAKAQQPWTTNSPDAHALWHKHKHVHKAFDQKKRHLTKKKSTYTRLRSGSTQKYRKSQLDTKGKKVTTYQIFWNPFFLVQQFSGTFFFVITHIQKLRKGIGWRSNRYSLRYYPSSLIT